MSIWKFHRYRIHFLFFFLASSAPTSHLQTLWIYICSLNFVTSLHFFSSPATQSSSFHSLFHKKNNNPTTKHPSSTNFVSRPSKMRNRFIECNFFFTHIHETFEKKNTTKSLKETEHCFSTMIFDSSFSCAFNILIILISGRRIFSKNLYCSFGRSDEQV